MGQVKTSSHMDQTDQVTSHRTCSIHCKEGSIPELKAQNFLSSVVSSLIGFLPIIVHCQSNLFMFPSQNVNKQIII